MMKVSIENNNAKMTGTGESASLSLTRASGVIVKKGYSPYVGTNGNWFEYSESEHRFVDTGIHAQGANGERGTDGKDGKTPVKGVDYKDGKDGVDGQRGADGVSATHSWNGTVLTITSASGTSSMNLKGERGERGEKGESGSSGSSNWSDIEGKPERFPPENHTHADYVKSNDSRLSDARTPKSHTHSGLRIGDNILEIVDGKGIQYDDGDDYFWLAYKSDIPTDAHINALIDAKIGGLFDGEY